MRTLSVDQRRPTRRWTNTLVSWTPVICTPMVAYAFLVLAAIAFRGLLPALVVGIVGVVVGVTIRKWFPER